ncbi:hypothetical protein FRB94_011703 [Tulasnella sp. JGI-2019a]|nr:hypothetical protein FRB94_011703 [Tulasnella sp. JGI-2019a]
MKQRGTRRGVRTSDEKGNNLKKGQVKNNTPIVAFFYGTLMHPRVLRRVIGNNGEHLETCSATLLSHTRLHIRREDVPAVVTSDVARKVMRGQALSTYSETVRGILVRGLTEQDLARLNEFEGEIYRLKSVSTTPISPWASLNDDNILSPPTFPDVDSTVEISALTYIWNSSIALLEPRIWSYDDFCRDKLARWL